MISMTVKEGRRFRYIGFTIESHCEKNLQKSEMMKSLENHCMKLFNLRTKDIGIRLIRYNGKEGIVKCNHIDKDMIIQILNSMKEISSKSVKIKTVGTSGTIKSLLKKFY
jgi:RNase P/RNase MRP subunit POP5